MPNEPQHPLEEFLRTYARKRRERVGAPFELHPATRKLLQTQVARTFPQRAIRPALTLAWLKSIWPRLAFAGSIVVAAGLAAVLFVQFRPASKHKLELAKQEAPPAITSDTREATPRPGPKPPPPFEQPPPQVASTRTTPSPAATALTNPTAVPRYAFRNDPASTTPKPIKLDPQPASPAGSVTETQTRDLEAVPSVDRLAGTTLRKTAPAAQQELLNQRFVQTAPYRRNFNSPARPQILNSFQLEQNGPRIRIVDADGSVYQGAIEQPATQTSLRVDTLQVVGRATAQSKPAIAGTQAAATAQTQAVGTPTLENFAFTVSGTNRTLRRAVVFYGNYIADTNTAQLGTANTQNRIQQSLNAANTAPTQNQSQLLNAVVQGKAVIGGSDRLEINAVPAEQ